MLISGREGNANLARYRDVPDSQSTISNTLLLLLHDTTFAEPSLFKTHYTEFTIFSTEITQNLSSNHKSNMFTWIIITTTTDFLYQSGHKVV